jgi:hypothetical protein
MTEHAYHDERPRPGPPVGLIVGGIIAVALIIGAVLFFQNRPAPEARAETTQLAASVDACAAEPTPVAVYNCRLRAADAAARLLPVDQQPAGGHLSAIAHPSVRNQPCDVRMSICMEWTGTYERPYIESVMTFIGRAQQGLASPLPAEFTWSHSGSFPASGSNPLPRGGTIYWWPNSAYQRP